MKGLILAAGRGTRLRPLTHTRPKPVIRVAGRPILHYAVENLREAGVEEIGVVVSPETEKDIREALAGYPVRYILQEEPQGLAHAVAVAQGFLGPSPFVLYLGDNLFQRGIGRFLGAFREGVSAVIALVRVEDPRQFGVALLEGERVVRLLEKPQDPPSDLAVAGVYVFTPEVFPVIGDLKPSARGEYEITDAIQGLIDRGKRVVGVEVEGWWKDTGRPKDLLDANRLLLEELSPRVEGEVEGSELTGRVVVERGARVVGSTVIGPAFIGEGAVVEGAYVGPFTSIGPGARVVRSEVEYSILEDQAVLEDVAPRLQESILGVRAEVKSRNGLPRAHRLILGDLSQVELA
ncbi:glucose-1-phosphate thymidylyltransferase [Thermus thermamylovorans]|uniref:Glucose-1-phosphate thymidylyltransferase n=1 Tax=Thermus thermamylovorans TaxID=2509362 RepID=A0A4Q9B578_9DEIN|nr:glucose-1-phosphate thymidylyltransferase [Thermus thermamylovorans]TBH20815.1 glucose-1-phosphate thymidylyltransferase [Thermus thermamylovorans]